MTRKDQAWLLLCFKTLADQACLKTLAALAQRDYDVKELVEYLKLSETAVMLHVGSLRQVGLVNLHVQKQQQVCRLNLAVLNKFKEAVGQVEQLPEAIDYSWIDALELELTDYDRKVLRTCTVNERIQELPEREKKLEVIVRWMATKFQAGIDYAEHEVNAILTPYFDDYASLRRALIDGGLLERESDGSRYRLVAKNE